jgi:hypothetical protein
MQELVEAREEGHVPAYCPVSLRGAERRSNLGVERLKEPRDCRAFSSPSWRMARNDRSLASDGQALFLDSRLRGNDTRYTTEGE